jgi:hypothetical protein
LPFRFSARRLRPSAPRAGSAAAATRPPAPRTILRPPLQQRLAGRIEALARVIARPHAHARRLAHTLRAAPMLALKLARKPPPPTAFYDYAEIPLASIIAAGEARAFPANTS